MNGHASRVVTSGYCVGYGQAYAAECTCGWYGNNQLYKHSARGDAYRHEQLIAQSEAAVRDGAV